MSKENPGNYDNQNRPGIVLLITLVVLVVLSTLGYTLTTRMSAHRHRDQYIIDYSQARYGCDSAVKYALATLEELEPELISRPNEPDFSDIFAMSEEQYEELLDQWAAELGIVRNKDLGIIGDINDIDDVGRISEDYRSNEVNDINDFSEYTGIEEEYSLQIAGPYGPPWPFVTERSVFEVGTAKVTIEIEDENAKYPIGWAILDDTRVKREADDGLETFCEWMGFDGDRIDLLKEDLKKIREKKKFKLDFKPMTTTVRTPATPASSSSKSGSRSRRTTRSRITRKTFTVEKQIAEQAGNFSRLFHSSMINIEELARPYVDSENRKESALKYMGLWATRKVNINTAPRHVLEAAFAFGGDKERIAQEIIVRRRIKPFQDFKELRASLIGYSDSIDKCEKYITTVSTCFTIKVTAVSGVAEASAIIAIIKEGKKIRRIAIINS